MQSPHQESQKPPLVKRTLYGLVVAAVLVGAVMLVERATGGQLKQAIMRLYQYKALFYGFYTTSELVLSFFPPELFSITYVLSGIELQQFIFNTILLAFISYGAGIVNYALGRYFSHTRVMQRIDRVFLSRYRPQLDKYGKYLLIAGALTPVPFSISCMLMGMVDMRIFPFLTISLLRFLRFAVYGWLVWTIPSFFGG